MNEKLPREMCLQVHLPLPQEILSYLNAGNPPSWEELGFSELGDTPSPDCPAPRAPGPKGSEERAPRLTPAEEDN